MKKRKNKFNRKKKYKTSKNLLLNAPVHSKNNLRSFLPIKVLQLKMKVQRKIQNHN